MRETIKLECYSGSTYAQRPRAFTWRGYRYRVQEVERTWARRKVRIFEWQKDGVFDLTYDEQMDAWFLGINHHGGG